MKTIKKTIKLLLISLLIIGGISAVVEYFIIVDQGEVIDGLYQRNDALIDREIKRTESMQAILDINAGLTEEINRIDTAGKLTIAGLKEAAEEYRNKEFKELFACQSNYDSLFSNYEKCLFSHAERDNADAARDKKAENLKKLFDLSEENYVSCQLRVDGLTEIIAVKDKIIRNNKKRNFWKKIKYYLTGAAFGAAGYAVFGKQKN